MLSIEQNEKMARVGPGTPMGQLLRRYWHPIAASSELKKEPTKAVRILGESLVLYRDRGGRLGLIGQACAHRRVNLLYGIPEQVGLRCPYHGWLYNEKGRCLEQPAEAPDSTFKERIRIPAYPVEELNGVVFAYLGPAPAPLVPRWDVYAMEDAVRDIGYASLNCNWLQIMENTLDPVHVEWLHQAFYDYAVGRTGRPDLQRGRIHHVKIGFDLFDYGIVKRRVVEGKTEGDDDWRIGHPMVFPNMLRQGGGMRGRSAFQVRVPMDDTHTAHWWVAAYPRRAEEPPQKPDEIPFYPVPVPALDEHGLPQWRLLDNNSGQDIMAWLTQGPIAERQLEKLAESDKGIILYRRLLSDQLRIVQDGGDPMNTFRDPARNACITFETEDKFLVGGAGYTPNAMRTGASTKYSPVLQQREETARRSR
jgi:5,5'-dehydrodivanillate O-demethylase